MIDIEKLVVVILAGGQGRRMGSNSKPLLRLGDKPLIQHVIDKVLQQTKQSQLLINANDNLHQYQQLGWPVQTDVIADYGGPLVGVLTAMVWVAEHRPEASHLLTIAADTPFFSDDYINHMCMAVSGAKTLAVASYQGRSQPVFGLWPVALQHDLRQAITQENIHKVDKFTSRYTTAEVVFSANEYEPHDPFFNINHPEDLQQAQQMLAAFKAAKNSH